ncbi:Mu-like prophage major head subunit gpT family protein [Albimonas sp. CAU 1670]|uniref:Mu-like prophage major head subunit gpT family protein n=1 Tax=Albimonas sp. CAU 1670 TaxID=3032599 RepID=UPI0023DCB3AE|nr:Mu-like prophage major head subunit gpT family protein [Albimonas sp. CAU 1670]MDF2232179.1 Mu-like prophage major head subunit gpT family protein [Albimonas sp. CAU 1670]
MLITNANLEALRVGFKTAFQAGLGMAPQMRERISTRIDSTHMEEKYGWLGELPDVREWVGERVVHSLKEHDYAIREKPWELTLGVPRRNIETDNLGTFNARFTAFGRSTGSKWETLVWGALKAGFTTECYDGQFYFDTDHPVIAEDGSMTTVSNSGGGSGTNWFLIDTNHFLLPVIHQVGKDFNFVAKDNPTDENVFNRAEFVYGAEGYANVGYSLWQIAYGSKQTLDASAYATARAAMTGMKGDYGRPLGLMPNLLAVPPALESAGRKILNSEYGTGGVTNEWKGTAELLVVPWLA